MRPSPPRRATSPATLRWGVARVALPLALALWPIGAGTGPGAQAAAPTTAGQTPVAPRTPAPDGLGLHATDVGGRVLWLQDGVDPEQAQWAVRGWETAVSLLPTLTGLPPPREPVPIYAFADRTAFQQHTSQLTGLPQTAIHEFEGGRVYAAASARGMYLNAAAMPTAAHAARLVAHEATHLAERDALGAHQAPPWFSEGLAEFVGQAAMAAVDPTAARHRQWRREAAVASAIHRGLSYAVTDLASASQWQTAARAGHDHVIYAQALVAVDWLAGRTGQAAIARVLPEMARGASFAVALEQATGLRPSGLAESLAIDHPRVAARYPAGVHAADPEGAPGTRFQFGAVGLHTGETLAKQFARADGSLARDHGAPSVVDAAGAAFWTFQSRADSPPTTWWLTVEGDGNTRATLSFHVRPEPALGDPVRRLAADLVSSHP